MSQVKDTRPIRDKTFQQSCIRTISEYLLQQRCPIPITQKTLTAPTTKEFMQLFRFLVSELIDPDFQWGKKFEEDAINVLKDLRYPAMEAMGKTALGTPGTTVAWPSMLAMLTWLVELCKVSCCGCAGMVRV
jgi:kinetochore protein NDC80